MNRSIFKICDYGAADVNWGWISFRDQIYVKEVWVYLDFIATGVDGGHWAGGVCSGVNVTY